MKRKLRYRIKKEGFLNTHYIIYNATHKGRTAAAARSTSSEPKGSYYHLNEKAQAASGLVKLVAATSDDSERYLNFPHEFHCDFKEYMK